MTESRYPLVTFALFTYNQAQFVEEAVAAALAQDYPNLEIIISDDASPDSTWEVIGTAVAAYAGPHHLQLNRNSRNIGLVAHVNETFDRANGGLIVVAAGDDVSCPTRVSKLVEAWTSVGRGEMALHSDAQVTEGTRKTALVTRGSVSNRPELTFERFVVEGMKPVIHGATAAYTPGLMRFFGRLNPAGGIEDVPLSFRALMLGRLTYVAAPLVNYRTNVGNISRIIKYKEPARTLAWTTAQCVRIKQHLSDYESYCANRSIVPDPFLLKKFREELGRYERAKGMASSGMDLVRGLYAQLAGASFRERVDFLFHFFDVTNSPAYGFLRTVSRWMPRG